MAESTLQAKRRIRLALRERLAAVSPSDAAAWSAEVCRRVAESDLFRSAKCLMLFVPTPGEADVYPLLDRARAAGKRVCLPRVDWALRVMSAAEAPASRDALIAGRHGISEPGPAFPAVPITELDLILVPGLAFDEQGGRLGRGAGFYDRFLAHPNLTASSIGVGFEVQMEPTLPRDSWDVPLHAIATERRWIQIE